MAKWAPAKTDTLDVLAGEIVHNYPGGRVIVAIDGDAGIGTGPFADDLAEALHRRGYEVARASIDAFRRGDAPAGQGVSEPGDYDPATYDYDAFRRDLVWPFRAGTAQAPPAASMLLVDGIYLHRPGLSGVWNYSVWLERASAGPEAAAGAAQRYVAESSPRTTASAIVDNGDPEHPRRVFADSC